jgi:2-phospho-L-lactate guanylyltransferase
MTASAATALPTPLWAVLPVKDFARAKSRLSPVLTAAERAAFARRLCEHALDTLAGCADISGVLVLSDSPEVLELAQRRGHHAERERPDLPPGPALGAILDDGLQRLVARGAQAALLLMADLPRVQRDDLSVLLHHLRSHDLVIAPDLREQNTNALALRLHRYPRTAFGSGDSFRLHLQRASDLGLRALVHRAPGLGFDVDLPGDHAELLPPAAPGAG